MIGSMGIALMMRDPLTRGARFFGLSTFMGLVLGSLISLVALSVRWWRERDLDDDDLDDDQEPDLDDRATAPVTTAQNDTSESTVRPSGPGWLCRLRRTPLVGQRQHHSGAAVGQCWWTWTSQSSGAVRQFP
jgi:hypothetical protein